VPAARQARWLEEGSNELWRQGVNVISWFLIRDQPPVPDYRSTYQSGLFGLDGAPKPAATAFRFSVRGDLPHDDRPGNARELSRLG
jgi:hypothetical protein